MPHYESVNGVARKVVKRYEPVNLVFRNVQSAYESVNGIARKVFSYIPFPCTINFWLQGASTTPRTIHEWFRGKSNGMWRFYLDTEGSSTDSSKPVSCVADIEGEIGGKIVTFVAKGTSTSPYTGSEDAIKLITRMGDTWQLYIPYAIYPIESSDFQTYSINLPYDVNAVRIGVWQSTYGRHQSELLISSFKIDGVELVY